jgi:hypothetical protein
MSQGTRRFSQLFRSPRHSPSGAFARVHPELSLALSSARQEQRAARLLGSRGHLVEGLRLTLRALDSAFQAAQLASARNEPAAALKALGIRRHERALSTLRRARTLDVPMLDRDVDFTMRVLMRDAGAIAHDLIVSIERMAPTREPSLGQHLSRWFSARLPRLPGSSSTAPSSSARRV